MYNFLVKVIADNLEKLRKYIESWNQYKVVWCEKGLILNLEEKHDNPSGVDLCEILFKS